MSHFSYGVTKVFDFFAFAQGLKLNERVGLHPVSRFFKAISGDCYAGWDQGEGVARQILNDAGLAP